MPPSRACSKTGSGSAARICCSAQREHGRSEQADESRGRRPAGGSCPARDRTRAAPTGRTRRSHCVETRGRGACPPWPRRRPSTACRSCRRSAPTAALAVPPTRNHDRIARSASTVAALAAIADVERRMLAAPDAAGRQDARERSVLEATLHLHASRAARRPRSAARTAATACRARRRSSRARRR